MPMPRPQAPATAPPAAPDDPLPPGDAMSSMMPMILMRRMRSRARAAEMPVTMPARADDPSAAWQPRIFVDGGEQQPTMTGTATSYTTPPFLIPCW